MGWIFKSSPNLSQNWLKFKKIWEKSGDFDQNLAKNWTDWYMNGSLFLEKLVFVWVYFQIPWRHLPTKTKLEYPPGPYPSLRVILAEKGTHFKDFSWKLRRIFQKFRGFRHAKTPGSVRKADPFFGKKHKKRDPCLRISCKKATH